MGFPEFPINNELFNQEEDLQENVQVTDYGSGQEQRVSLITNPRRKFKLTFPALSEQVLNTLWTFYRQSRKGPLLPFIFTSKYSNRYNYIQFDGTTNLQFNGTDFIRLGTQKYAVRFTNNVLTRRLFGTVALKIGLGLTQDLDRTITGEYIRFLEDQYATITDTDQDLLEMGNKDWMIEFWARSETILKSKFSNYAGLNGLTLIFSVDSINYTVTFTAGAVDAATTVNEINLQQGTHIEAAIVDTDRIEIKSLETGYFFVSGGTAAAQFSFRAGDIFPVHKHNGTDGYFFEQRDVNQFSFVIESGGVQRGCHSLPTFNFSDGRWHYYAGYVDKSLRMHLYIDSVRHDSTDVTALGHLNNNADFFLNLNAPRDIEMDEVRVWAYGQNKLPANIVSQIQDHFENPFIIDDSFGLKSRWNFDNEDGNDSWSQEDLTLVNSPAFFERSGT